MATELVIQSGDLCVLSDGATPPLLLTRDSSEDCPRELHLVTTDDVLSCPMVSRVCEISGEPCVDDTDCPPVEGVPQTCRTTVIGGTSGWEASEVDVPWLIMFTQTGAASGEVSFDFSFGVKVCEIEDDADGAIARPQAGDYVEARAGIEVTDLSGTPVVNIPITELEGIMVPANALFPYDAAQAESAPIIEGSTVAGRVQMALNFRDFSAPNDTGNWKVGRCYKIRFNAYVRAMNADSSPASWAISGIDGAPGITLALAQSNCVFPKRPTYTI